MAYVAWSVVFGEQPTAAKWNILGTNDASFNDGTGIADDAIIARHIADDTILKAHLDTASGELGGAWTQYTATNTGLASTSVNVTRYYRIGKTIILWFDIAGTSNSTSWSFTLPVNAKAVTSAFVGTVPWTVSDNGVSQTTPGRVYIDVNNTPSVATVEKTQTGTGWTASGTKAIRGILIYESV